MTEKRFRIVGNIKNGTESGIWDNQKQNNQRIGDELWIGEVVDLLNKLSDENEQLKQSYYELRCRHSDLHKICIDFEEDVEHLKQENEQIKGDRDYWRTFAQSLIKENEKRCYDD